MLELLYFSDVFFSIWLNDVPSQLNNNIKLLFKKDGVSFSSTANFFNYQHLSSVLAIRTLEYNLRQSQSSNNNNHMKFLRQQNRNFPYLVKSSSPNDNFIFLTNILPINIERIPFNISKDNERGTRKNLPKGMNASFFISHTTLHAVDKNTKTCWESTRNVSQGDFFAIDFLFIRTNLSFSLTIGHTQELQKQLDLNLSFDGLRWITYRSLNGITIKKRKRTSNKYQYEIVFNSNMFNNGFRSFRYVAFNNSKPSTLGKFQVCDVQIISDNPNTRL